MNYFLELFHQKMGDHGVLNILIATLISSVLLVFLEIFFYRKSTKKDRVKNTARVTVLVSLFSTLFFKPDLPYILGVLLSGLIVILIWQFYYPKYSK